MPKILMLAFLTGLIFSSTAKAEVIPGVEGPFINFVDGKILVDVKLTQVELPGGLAFIIPKTNKSTFGISPNIEGGSLVTVTVDPEDFKLVDIGIGLSNTLPDGRPIVGIAGGELKDSLRLDLEEKFYNVSIYYHKTLFGIYIPFRFNLGPVFRSIAIPLKWKGKNVGLISVAQAEGSHQASGTIFLNLKLFKQDKELQERLRLSKMYPGAAF